MKTFKILVAENDPTMRAQYDEYIRSLGHLPVIVKTAQEAWDKLRHGDEKFDLVVSSDWTGGDGNLYGSELLLLVRNRFGSNGPKFILTYLHEDGEYRKKLSSLCVLHNAQLIYKLNFYDVTRPQLDLAQNQIPLNM